MNSETQSPHQDGTAKGFEGIRLGMADRSVLVFGADGQLNFAREGKFLDELSFRSWEEFVAQLRHFDEEVLGAFHDKLETALGGESIIASIFVSTRGQLGVLSASVEPLLPSAKRSDRSDCILVTLDFVDYSRALGTLDELCVNAVLLGENMTVLACNDAASELLGHDRQSVQGQNFATEFVIDDESTIALIATFEEVHKSNRSIPFTRLEIRSSLTAGAVCGGKLIPVNGYVTMLVLLDRTAEAYAASELYGARTAEVTHRVAAGSAREFNNLLSIIDGNTRFLSGRMDSVDTDVAEAVDDALSAIDSSKKLNQRLLDFLSPDPKSVANVEITRFLSGFVDFVRMMFPTSFQIHLDQLPSESEGIILSIPEHELETALLAVCFNAREAMDYGERGHLWITLSVWHAADGGTIGISMEDNGRGMSPEVLERCFEPFFSTRAVGVGNGMGLPAVREFAREHGGDCVVDSIDGKGTTLTLTLPFAFANDDRRSRIDSAQIDEGEENPSRQDRVAVLLVDDDARVRKVARRDLGELGLEVIDVASAEEALDVLDTTSGSIGLVVSDVVMDPGMNGFELRRQVVTRFPDLPVILISGYANIEGSEEVPYLISKPYKLERLKEVISECLS